jgi:hypothetical protein
MRAVEPLADVHLERPRGLIDPVGAATLAAWTPSTQIDNVPVFRCRAT